MSNDDYTKQCLSDFLDGEVSDKTIEQLLSDPKAAESLYRYQTIRSAVNNELSAHNSFQLTQLISGKIAQESVLNQADFERSINSSDSDKVSVSVVAFPSWKKRLTGFSIAASVALATVFSVQMFSSLDSNQTGINGLVSQEKLRSSSEIATEQAELEQIQQMLELSNQKFLQANEELVGGDYMTRSIVLEAPEKESDVKEKNTMSASEAEKIESNE